MRIKKRHGSTSTDNYFDSDSDSEVEVDDIFNNSHSSKEATDLPPGAGEEDLGFHDGGDMGGISPMDKHSDLLKGLTDFEPFMRTMVSEWLGMVWSEKDEKYIDDPDVSPTMNLYGARWCVNQLRTYTRDNNIITNLDTETYKYIISDIIDTVWLNLGCRAEEFGIDNDGDILKVSTQLIHAAMLVLIGTGGSNNYKDLLTKSVSRNESVQYHDYNRNFNNSAPKKRGFLSSIAGVFGKS